MRIRPFVFVSLLSLWLAACESGSDRRPGFLLGGQQGKTGKETKAAGNNVTESFESGSKSNYKSGEVKLSTGLWRLDGAMIGSSAKDHKQGQASLRIGDTGTVTMLFDVRNTSGISVQHSLYGNDPASSWTVWYATDSGKQWKQAGKPVTTASASMKTVTFPLKLTGPVRFQIRKTGGGRVNVDDIIIKGTTGTSGGSDSSMTATRDDNMAMGNPSKATTDPQNRNNYLMVKPQYVLSYNDSKGIPNWVSWHLSTAWRGNAVRVNRFAADRALPASFFKVMDNHYDRSGFDRGHICPSDDRDGSAEDNLATFLMTNMTPQAPFLNQQPWMWLEGYCRELAAQGKELYIVAGGYGEGGIGSKGPAQNIANGHITVPAHFWKVVVVLPVGTDDLRRVTAQTRVIAVDMPNAQTANAQNWPFYRTTVDQIEAATGYDLLSNLPQEVQQVLEAEQDKVSVK